MNNTYHFNKVEAESISGRFGSDFYNKLPGLLALYSQKWHLNAISLIPSYSAGLVFTCLSEERGPSILKLEDPNYPDFTAYAWHTLLEYGGKGFCKPYEADLEKGVLLIERILPGIALREEKALDKRLSVFIDLYKKLHRVPSGMYLYPSYRDWVVGVTDKMKDREDCRELYGYMAKAKAIFLSVEAEYKKQVLLHGDFHHDNILLGNDGHYVLIDPKGVLGHPVFDLPRFILNEFEDNLTKELKDKISYIIRYLEGELSIPAQTLRRCLYVEAVMAQCWDAENTAAAESLLRLTEAARFAESLL